MEHTTISWKAYEGKFMSYDIRRALGGRLHAIIYKTSQNMQKFILTTLK